MFGQSRHTDTQTEENVLTTNWGLVVATNTGTEYSTLITLEFPAFGPGLERGKLGLKEGVKLGLLRMRSYRDFNPRPPK